MQAGVDRGEAGEHDEVGNPGEASEESVEDSGNNPDGIGKTGGDGSQLSSGHQPVEPPPTCSASTKKVRFNEQPPTEDAVTKQVLDIEPKNTGGGKVSQPAILAPEEARVSSHDIIYYDKVNVLDKTPADDEVSPTSDAILATWSSEPYVEDKFPEDADLAKLNRRYKAVPEEFYSKTGLHPVTPQNFGSWFAKAKGRKLKWHMWELASGSGRLSLICLMAGLIVGFPVDYRYGWDLNNPLASEDAQSHSEGVPARLHSPQPGLCSLVTGRQYQGSSRTTTRADAGKTFS